MVRDTVDYSLDNNLANFVISSHMKAREFNSNKDNGGAAQQQENPEEHLSPAEIALRADPAYGRTDMIPQALLRKYIYHARASIHPKLSRVDDDKIAKLYSDLRRESMVTGGIPIAVRHIESIIRMSEAHAKMHLRKQVIEEDVDLAIRVMLESFISSQKFAVMRPLRAHFEKYLTYKKDQFELLLFALNGKVQDQLETRLLKGATPAGAQREPVKVSLEEFTSVAEELRIANLEKFFDSPLFKANAFKVDQRREFIVKTFPNRATDEDDE